MKNRIFSLTSILFLIVLQAVIYHRWLFQNSIFTYGDVGFFIDSMQKQLVGNFFSALISHYGFGFLNLALSTNAYLLLSGILASVGVSAIAIEKIFLFYPIVFGASLGSFVLFRNISRSNIGGIIGSLVYSLNTYFLITLTGQLYISLAYALTPLLLWLFVHMLEKSTLKKQIIFALAVSFVGFIEFRILYIAVWIFIFYFLYSCIFNKFTFSSLLKRLASFIFPALAIIGLNIFWVIPIFASHTLVSNSLFNRNLFGNEYFSLPMAITLFHAWWTGAKPTVFIVEPIPFYFWLIPICAFSALLFYKKNRLSIFFAFLTLLGVFLTKQSDAPFSHGYQWLYAHVPGFNAFREASKFYILSALGFGGLLSIYTSEVLSYAYTKSFMRVVGYISIALIAAIFLWNAKPIITGEIDTMFTAQQLPTEYISLQNVILSQDNFTRILNVPSIQRFVYSDDMHPAVSFFSLPPGLQSLNTKLLSLEGIRFVITPFDSMDDLYGSYGTEKGFLSFIANQWSTTGFTFLKHIGGIRMWQNTQQPAPHIMPVKDFVYVINSSSVKDIIDLPTSPQVAYFLQSTDNKEGQINPQALQSATKIYSVASCIRCDLSKPYYKDIIFPYARILPGSPLYPLISYKEKKATPSTLDSIATIKNDVFLSEKRMVEVQEMLTNKVRNIEIHNTIDANNILLGKIDAQLTKLTENISANDAYLYVYDYLILERKTIEDTIAANTFDDSTNVSALKQTIDTIDSLTQKILQITWVTKDNDVKLALSIPQNDSYKIVLRDDPEFSVQQVSINALPINFSHKEGEFLVSDSLPLSSGQNLVEETTIPKNLLSTSSAFLTTAQKIISDTAFPITGMHDASGMYRLSFDYRLISGDSPKIHITDDASVTSLPNQWIGSILTATLQDKQDGKFHHVVYYLTPHYGSTQTTLHFIISNLGDQESSVQVENLQLQKIPFPTIVAIHDTGKQLYTPQISFEEHNPNYYTIQVKDAKNPYFLSFSDTYDDGWILSNPASNTVPAKKIIDYPLYGVEEHITSESLPTHMMTMLSKRYPLPDTIHLPVNTFGNGWIINKNGNYTLDLVFKPEQNYIIGLGISSFVAVLLVLLLAGSYIWRKKS